MTHPYASQPARAFWRQAVTPHHPLDVPDLYRKRWSLDGARIAAAGSCFAQHLGRALREGGFAYLDAEPAPPGLPAARHAEWGYGLYSARYGNVYTARQMLQLVRRALGRFTPSEPAWRRGGGVVDPFRPTIEPEPFRSEAELDDLRRDHLDRVAELIRQADVLVFTLGLTEAWESRADGAVFPLCPGTTAGGTFDPARHAFRNLTTAEVRADLDALLAELRGVNPGLRVLLTVSPVPLMATATDHHVVVATTRSKAVLRAVAGELADADPLVDYFPSYEIITAPHMRGAFFQPDGREVSHHGVAHVMRTFFAQHPPPARAAPAAAAPAPDEASVQCDEVLLAAFGAGRA